MNKVKLKLFIEKFEAFLKKYPHEKVNMLETSYNGCGSPACHGGWMHAIIGEKYAKPKTYHGYAKGSDLLGIFLGFEKAYAYDLESWARDNPEIWGNENGESMFGSANAFDEGEKNYDYKNLNLSDILYKWKKVYERLHEQSKT